MAHNEPVTVRVARVYDVPDPDVTAVLVDRLWPRGLARAQAPFGRWLKEVAPTTELRRWYGHRPDRFGEFARRYEAELATVPAAAALAELRTWAAAGPVVLVTATRDVDHAAATVLQRVLAGG